MVMKPERGSGWKWKAIENLGENKAFYPAMLPCSAGELEDEH